MRRLLAANLPEGFNETKFVGNLPEVTSMDFSPDGRLFITELDGKVRIIKNGQKLSTPFLSVNVDRYNNRGLIGIEFDPNFAVNRYVYIYYSTVDPNDPDVKDNDSVNRLSRFRASNTNKDVVEAGSEVVLVDNIPNDWGGHNGGALHFGKDGMLYVTTGDAAVTAYAQNLNNLAGKILRLNTKNYPNSIIPSDNPFVGQSNRRPEIWAYGLRHPYTAAIHPTTGQYLVNDVGADKFEEINEIQKGRNYGWGNVEGSSSNSAYKNPLHQYSHNGSGAAVVGGTFYTGSQFPAAFKDQYFFSDFEDGWMKVLDPVTKDVDSFATNLRAPIDIDMGPDGSLYYLAYNDRYSTANDRSVYRFEYVGAGNRAPAAEYTVNPTSGTAPLTVTFDASDSSDPDGDPLTFLWDFGDGTTSTEEVVTHTYTTAGVFQPTLVASDPGGLFDHDTLPTINANNSAPVGTITMPVTGSTYRAGDTILFAGSGSDAEDGTLGNSAFSWSIRLFHNEHSHPFLTFNNTDGSSFTLPNPLDEAEPSQWYRITLTVKDSAGAAHSSFVDVTPMRSTVTITTNVPGLKLTLDGQAVSDGHTFVGVENAIRTIGTPTVQTLNGKWYQFESWSDGGAAQHEVNTPYDDATFTAQFVEIPPPETATLNPGGDAYVRNGTHGNTNFGDEIELIVKQSPNAGNTREAYVRFDTTGAPTGTATLRLFGQLGNLTGGVENVPVAIHGVSDTGWDEAGLTYNNRSAAGPQLDTATVLPGAAQWYEWDVSDYVQAEKAAGRDVIVFALRPTGVTEPYAVFGSEESANRPELVLAAETPEPPPPPPPPPGEDETVPAVADSTVRDGSFGSTNYGEAPDLLVKRSANSGNSREAYIRFDTSAATGDGAVTLRLFGQLGNLTGTIKNVPVGLHGVSDVNWSEEAISYNNRPTAGALLDTTTVVQGAAQWYEWDVTDYVMAERAAGRPVVGFALRATGTTDPYAAFGSTESAAPPELVFDADEPAPPPVGQTIPLAPADDGTTRDGSHASTNHGNDQTLQAKWSGTSGNTREAYLKFDLSATTTISAARLRLYGLLTNVIDGGNPTIGVYASATTAWTEDGLTWNTRPTTGSSPLATQTAGGTTGQWYEWDLTAFLQAEKAAGRSVVTLALKGVGITNSIATFNSGEAAANQPELWVTP